MQRPVLISLIFIGAFVVCVVLIVTLVKPPPIRPPYRFLGEHRRLDGQDTAYADRRYVGFYSFKADYNDLIAKAKAELVPLGYTYESWPHGVSLRYGPRTNPTPMVVIKKDMKMKRADQPEILRFWNQKTADKGWITVEVEGLEYKRP